jgi:hypothetical protein
MGPDDALAKGPISAFSGDWRKVPRGPVARGSRETMKALKPERTLPVMDIEQINAIGHHLVDLSERTIALRGYL